MRFGQGISREHHREERSTPLAAKPINSMEVCYTAALIGLGRIAWRFDAGRAGGPALTHFGSFLRHPQVRVICGHSPVSQELVEFQSETGVPTCERFAQVLEKRPGIVSICSRSEAHFEQTLACLEHEIPMVWLEKPPTTSLEELDALIAHPSIRDGKTKVLVNYMRRYSKLYERFLNIYRLQSLGRPLSMQVLYSRGLELNGSHFLDLVFSMLGERPPTQLAISDDERRKPSPTFFLRFADDFVVSFCGHDTSYHINDMVLVCEDGRASVLSGGLETRIEMKTENERHGGFYRLKGSDATLLSVNHSDDPFYAALTDLITAHETAVQPRSNLATARCAQALTEDIRRP